jgi:hypothetical protein
MPKTNPARSRRPAACWPVIVLTGLVGSIGVCPGPARVEADDTAAVSSWAFRRPRPVKPPVPRDSAWVRTPVADGRYPDKPAGRDHNPYGFTTWLAGGGIKGGKVIGATDEFGLRAVEDPVHVNDLHATILRLLGLDHRELTYLFEGRDQRLTDVGGDREFADRLLA